MLLLFSVDFVHNCVLIIDVGKSEGCDYVLPAINITLSLLCFENCLKLKLASTPAHQMADKHTWSNKEEKTLPADIEESSLQMANSRARLILFLQTEPNIIQFYWFLERIPVNSGGLWFILSSCA
ncbi:hypothetical protein L3X38_010016 [Prunus dulcis]|uniref:Uncharacterized protein n=1 Tax=Prunus dulcis TaxID=3755 RepID=A0AAD4ZE18_PRUDU|nr:hypothetical protein L3X38_010016 [Prunus dulcis]